MAIRNFLFSSESVTEGHPDKIADQISDAVLDAILESDPYGRVACETLVTTGLAFIAGEVSTTCYADIPSIARQTIREIGYTRAKYGFDCETCSVITAIDEQSRDIAQGVDTGGAGDQGLMFGYACDETPELMPLPIMMAHKLVRRLSEVRRSGEMPYLRPDGKSQVTVEYRDGKPHVIQTVVIAAQHSPDVKMRELREDVVERVIEKVIPADLRNGDTKYHINATGRFAVGGPQADAGLTGRKIIVDTYGGFAAHGGGAFSGKDPSKVDRSGSYMARYIAKNIVAAGLAQRVQVQVAYSIGVADPVSVMAECYGTNVIPEEQIVKLIREIFPLTPKGMIQTLDLLRPIYRQTAAFGHFGRNEPGFTWELTDKVDELRSGAGL